MTVCDFTCEWVLLPVGDIYKYKYKYKYKHTVCRGVYVRSAAVWLIGKYKSLVSCGARLIISIFRELGVRFSHIPTIQQDFESCKCA